MVTQQKFIAKIKEKYPAYADVKDEVLYQKIIKKYPVYEKQIQSESPWQGFMRGIEGNITSEDVRFKPGLPSPAHFGYIAGTVAPLGMTAPQGPLAEVSKMPEIIKALKPTTPKNKLYETGKKMEEGLKSLRREYGKYVGETKEAVKTMKVPIDVSDILVNASSELKDTMIAGKSTLSSSDQRAIKEVLDILKTSGARQKPKELMLVKELIDNKYLSYVNRPTTLRAISTNGERILGNIKNQIDSLLTFHDLRPELGGTGQLAKVNQQYAKISRMYSDAKSLLGTDYNLRNKVLSIGKELAEDNPAYVKLFGELDSITPSQYKFADDLAEVVSGMKLSNKIDRIWGIGQIKKIGETIGEGKKYLGLKAAKLLPGLQIPIRQAGATTLPLATRFAQLLQAPQRAQESLIGR